MRVAVAVLLGYLLDLLLGERLTALCPAVLAGRLIKALEDPIRRALPRTDAGELAGGAVLATVVCAVFFLVPWAAIHLLEGVHWAFAFALETFWAYQILATRGLADAGLRVRDDLVANDLPAARASVAMIVGRDTGSLSEGGVARAAVESVAENTSDGSIAPLLYLLAGGAPLGMLYKAINTMDSMLGYRNSRYRRFGTCAARLDDLANLVPARVSALLVAAVARPCGMDASGALRCWWRDRYRHPSPNSAHCEAAFAGALGIQLGGDSTYGGVLVRKPTLGDPVREVCPDDIGRACRLLLASSAACCVLGAALRVLGDILV